MLYPIRALAAAALTVASLSASAASLNKYIGVLTPSTSASPNTGLQFVHAYGGPGKQETFHDVFSFQLGGGNTISGSTTDTNMPTAQSTYYDVVLTSIALRDQATQQVLGTAVSPSSFSFTNLSANHTYELLVEGSVLGGSRSVTGNYTGTMSASTTQVAAPVPEPAELVLTAMGLVGVGYWGRRSRQA